MRPYVADTGLVLGQALDEGATVLLEGAQGSLLDIDHGTYPFVTSSNPTAGGACVGVRHRADQDQQGDRHRQGVHHPGRLGPVPDRAQRRVGEFLRKIGGEYGVTTGRARRTGWFDAVIARYATRVNGVTDFFVTKLDVLSNLDKVPVCVAYEVDGKRYDEIPMTQTEFHHAKPVYEYLDGWWEDISRGEVVRGPAQGRSRLRPGDRGAVRRPGRGRRRRPAARPDAVPPAAAVATCRLPQRP